MTEKIIMPKNVQSFVDKYGGIGSKEQNSAFWKEFRKAANAYANVQAKRICDLEHTLAESRKLETELAAVTEQRDELLRYNEAYRKDALICADCDAISKEEYDRAIERWNKLADLVRQFIYILDITEESDGGRLFHPTNITSCRAGDLQKAGQLVEALRRAIKGEADEIPR